MKGKIRNLAYPTHYLSRFSDYKLLGLCLSVGFHWKVIFHIVLPIHIIFLSDGNRQCNKNSFALRVCYWFDLQQVSNYSMFLFFAGFGGKMFLVVLFCLAEHS